MKEKKVELTSSNSVAIQGSTKTVYKYGGTNNTKEKILRKKSGKPLVFRSKRSERN